MCTDPLPSAGIGGRKTADGGKVAGSTISSRAREPSGLFT